MDHAASCPFGTPDLSPAIAHLETGEKLLDSLESNYVSIIRDIDDLKQIFERFGTILTDENIQNLQNSIRKLSKNQLADLSILLGLYAQEQSWIDPKQISEKGKLHSYSVVKKNLLGQDSKYTWARGSKTIRDLCDSQLVNGKVMFLPKGLVAEFAISFFYLRRSLNLLSNSFQILEEIMKFTETLKPMAERFFELADKSDESLKQYPQIPQVVLDSIQRFATMRKEHFSALVESEKKSLDSAWFHQQNEKIDALLADIRNSSNLDILLILRTVPFEKAREILHFHKAYLEQCMRFLQGCKSFIEFEAKNRELRRVKHEFVTLMSKFSDVDKMIVKLVSDYKAGNINKEQYEKQQIQLDKILGEILEKMIMVAEPFQIRRDSQNHSG
jgi:hypothetical protein